jgi:uncharacterized metal-binding protein YceD (DUF177 family)
MTPEFSRPLGAADIAQAGQTVRVEATAAECAALARRFRLPAIESLACRFSLRREGRGVVAATGYLSARVVQICVATLDEFSALVEERFAICFVPDGSERNGFDPDAVDEIPYAAGVLDLGEAAAEELALALDPWPRKPGADSFGSGHAYTQ